VVVTPRVRDGYTPERSGNWHEEQFSAAFGGLAGCAGLVLGESAKPLHSSGRGLNRAEGAAETALRLLEAPESVDVDRDPSPRRIFWRGRAIVVTNAVGPERLSGDWWNDGYSRDYWRCESDAGLGELVLYRDEAGWWVQGWYD
jgi:hypothetical protein